MTKEKVWEKIRQMWEWRRRMAIATTLSYATSIASITTGEGAMIDLPLEQFQVFNKGIKEVAAALREGNLVLHEANLAIKEGQPRVYSEEEVFKELENIGVEEEFLFLAYNFITSNPGLVKAFFGCPTHRRKAWLVQFLRASSNTC